jgi:hypothetical protein
VAAAFSPCRFFIFGVFLRSLQPDSDFCKIPVVINFNAKEQIMNAVMEARPEPEIYRHGKDRNFTRDEADEIRDRAMEAYDRGDREEFRRIYKAIPISPNVVEAFAGGYGKDAIMACGFDLTEANLKLGEGWLNAYARK